MINKCTWLTDKAPLFICSSGGSCTSNSRRCSGHQSTQRLPWPLWPHLLTLIKTDTEKHYSPFARSPQDMLACRTSNALSMTRRPPSCQDTGGLALRLTPGQSFVEMSHFQIQNEDSFHSEGGQASLFFPQTQRRPAAEAAYHAVRIRDGPNAQKMSKRWKRAWILSEYSAESCSQWEIHMPSCTLEVCC